MRLGALDLLALVWVSWGVYLGRKRGLGRELVGALSVFIFFLTGCGLYRWTDRALTQVSHITGQAVGVLSFFGLAVAAIMLVRHFRGRAQDWAERRYDGSQRKLRGAILGGVRTFLLACVVLLVMAHWPLHFLTRPFVESSMLGRCLTRWVLPVYEKTHGTL